MRLLDTETGQFVEKDPASTEYAILSHTWRRSGEQMYQELKKIQKRYSLPESPPNAENSVPSSFHDHAAPVPASPASESSEGDSDDLQSGSIWNDVSLSRKIRDACAVARANGCRYIWIDSCCIDKTSSSELSEAINSMYSWYMKAHVCFAYLADVPAREDHQEKGSCFRNSRWFTRGWTLQELIAPRNVVFLSEDWTVIGLKAAFADLVWEITGIDVDALLHLQPLSNFSIAQRFSWASKRNTTRVEDLAYSLLGIFNINMPTLYGEGRAAFRRLQEEIMSRIPDQSLFGWTFHGDRRVSRWGVVTIDTDPSLIPLLPLDLPQVTCFPEPQKSLLATTPNCFNLECGCIRPPASNASHDVFSSVRLEYAPTPYGIRTQFQMIPLFKLFPPSTTVMHCPSPGMELAQWYLAILGCVHAEYPDQFLGRICYIPPSESGVEHLLPGYLGRMQVEETPTQTVGPLIVSPPRLVDLGDLFRLTLGTLQRCRSRITLKTVYISHDDQYETASEDPAFSQRYHSIKLFLLRKTRDALAVRGYSAQLREPDHDQPATYQLTLLHDDHIFTVTYRVEPIADNGWWFTIYAHVEISQPSRRASGAREEGYESVPSDSTVSWSDATPWKERLGRQCVAFKRPGAPSGSHKFGVYLDLEFTATGMYVLHVEID